MSKRIAKKVLLIGWDAADWKVIKPLIAEGKMPTLAKFIAEGVHGKIKTLDPPLSPMLWTSMATGYRADKHGILGFIEPLADNSGIRPVTSTSRKVRAIWNILHNQGMRSNVVGWWPSNPAEPINGVMVSNLYQQANKPLKEKWEMLDGTVHPAEMSDVLKDFRVHPQELTFNHLAPFIPNLKKLDTKKEKRISSIAKIIAHASSIHAASTYLQRETDWDFMAVYHDAIDHFSHLTMKFHPPMRPGIPKEMFENYKDVVNAGYMFHDMMLERTLSMVDDDTVVMIVSDHGFHSDHLRPKYLIKEPAAPAQEHSPYGIVCMRGPGIKKGQVIHGASVLDVTPTLLSLYGLPIGENMEGKPLLQAFEENIQPSFIKDWEKEEGDFGMHKKNFQEDPWAAQEAMQQLIELGYIDAPDENISIRIENSKNESQYYLARNLINASKFDQAIEILEDLVANKPKEVRYGQRLAFCYLSTNRFRKCRVIIDQLKEIQAEIEKEDASLSEEELNKKRKGFMREAELPNYLLFVEGLLFMKVNKWNKALALFEEVKKAAPNNFDVFLNMAKSFLQKKRWEEAEAAFINCLAIDDTSAVAHHGLGISFLRRNLLEPALDELFLSLDINNTAPSVHFHVGEALVKLNKHVEAEQAFKAAVSLSPGMTKAHKWLADLYENELNQPEKAKEHHAFLKQNIRGEITIVSGLPRSGTSMMMQILDAAELDVLTDKKREPDNNNPKGYYEYEPVKKLMVDKSWLPNAEGKVVKVIAQLLPYLPANYNYKIIFMRRDMAEVLTSQQVMLGKEKDISKKAFPTGLNDAFTKQLNNVENWIESQPNIDILNVNYKNVIDNSKEELESIASFLGFEFDEKKTKNVIDKKLYRNRK
ncbi:MAG: alkaline phosphatase family protein [Parvicellaceae bacterium]